MSYNANVIVGQAKSWIGLKESDNSFLEILKVYNDMPKTHGIALPRGHKMAKTDSWCACFTSACALAVNYHDIIPIECSCTKIIAKAKEMGIWVEDESIKKPKTGWLILYDWDDKSGKSDNTGGVEHIGIIEKVENGKITVIEGNYNNAVKRRVIDINGKYIRGYVAPKYDDDTSGNIECEVNIKLAELSEGSKGAQVKAVQRILKDMGYDLGSYGVDGEFGTMTDKAVKAFQKAEKLEVDGIVGINTWTKLLKG